MNNEKWQQLYMLAATEVDGNKIPERIAAVREAIRGRLQDLEHSSDHHAERKQLKDSLIHLDYRLNRGNGSALLIRLQASLALLQTHGHPVHPPWEDAGDTGPLSFLLSK
jgi:hypothetical protein